jgi:hypothetical protein
MYRYQFDREKSAKLKQTLNSVNQIVRQLEINLIKANKSRKILSRSQCIEALDIIERRRMEVLSDMSDPFKQAPQERSQVVINL